MKIVNNKNIILSGSYIEHVTLCLKKGRIVILPTSTIYGISCIYNQKNALERVYEIKKRGKDIPFIILISDISWLYELAEDINKTAKALIKKYWISYNPVPLTLLFRKNKNLKQYITRGSDRIAIRMDPLNIIKEIINKTGPVISTSATISGQKGVAPKNVNEIPDEIKKNVDLVLDLEKDLPGIESTIIDVSSKKTAIIRKGIMKFDDLKNII